MAANTIMLLLGLFLLFVLAGGYIIDSHRMSAMARADAAERERRFALEQEVLERKLAEARALEAAREQAEEEHLHRVTGGRLSDRSPQFAHRASYVQRFDLAPTGVDVGIHVLPLVEDVVVEEEVYLEPTLIYEPAPVVSFVPEVAMVYEAAPLVSLEASYSSDSYSDSSSCSSSDSGW